jgi:hypothetical protein
MRRTTVLVVLLLALVGTAGVFASGKKEQPAQPGAPGAPYGAPGPRGNFRPPRAQGWPQGPTFSEEKTTVTGQLYYKNRIHPELKGGGKDCELLVPRFYVHELNLQEGVAVTVEGYEVTGMPYRWDEADNAVRIWVTKAIIDGKEYDLQRNAQAPWLGGHRRGMMGPRGRGEWGRGRYGPPCWGDDWGPGPYGRHG